MQKETPVLEKKNALLCIVFYLAHYFWLRSNIFWRQLQILFKKRLAILEPLLGRQRFIATTTFLDKNVRNC